MAKTNGKPARKGTHPAIGRELRKKHDAALTRIAARALNHAFNEMIELEIWLKPQSSIRKLTQEYFAVMSAELERRRAAAQLITN
jgi:hypothetical protein